MAQQIINVGSAPNDGTGDVLRNSQIKANANFTELYLATSSSVQSVTGDSVDNTDPLNPIINAIPLSGTTVGNPVTGNIDVINNVVIQHIDGDLNSNIAFNNTEVSINSYDNATDANARISISSSGSIQIYTTDSVGDPLKGISGGQDFTPNITDLDYVQKKYVDTGLALKQNKFFSYKLTTPSPSVTGTLSETELVRIPIIGGTFSANDVIRIPTILITKIGVNNAATVRLKISTSPTMPTGTTGQIAQFTVNATSLFQQVNRIFYINGGNLKGWPFTTAANTDISASTNAMSSVAFDNTVTQYLYISCGLLSPLDSLRIEGLQIMNS